MPDDFLPDRDPIEWDPDDSPLEVDGVYLGEGAQALEVVVARSSSRPTKQKIERLWRDRWDQRATPVLVVALYGSSARVFGPDENGVIDEVGLDPDQLRRICEAALDKPDRHAARRFLKENLTEAGDGHPGLRNQGLLSTHELMTGVPQREDWDDAQDQARPLLTRDGKELVKGLGYELESLTGQGYVLKDQGRESAVAVFLEEDEAFDRKQERFTGDSPVAYGLNKAEQKNLDRVIVNSGGTLRLFTTDPEDGFGSRGRTDTYVEINTDILDEDDAGYLWLLFSAPALRRDGTLEEIMEFSEEYAADLGARLRERIYDEVIPDLAQALARARDLEDPTREELDETYEMALILLYRLLFIAYNEDERHLPRNQNPRYDPRSLKQKARELHDLLGSDVEFDERSTTHWDDVMELTQAIHAGHREWGLPEYDGTLLSSNSDISPAGGRLASVELTDDEFGPILQNLLIDETEEGYQGPVDFRNIGVREFGVIYEGLLESELSVADTDLTIEIEDKKELYVPAEEGDPVRVEEGDVYLHGLSGERKSTGTYYTKKRFVEHLLDHSLEVALDEHLERLDSLSDRDAEDAFFDFSVADIAMGSGHFLVAAVDRIEAKFSQYLHNNNLPAIEEELDQLKAAAEEAFEDAEATPEIERDQLLRRQIARRCVYGVDINPLATELARLSLWVHTFVPGLPLTFLDYNLVDGDALAGVGTLKEISDVLGLSEDQVTLGTFTSDPDAIEEIQSDIEQAKNLAETNAKQVEEARQTRDRVDDKLEPVRARLDILTASLIEEDIDSDVVTDETVADPVKHPVFEKSQEVLDPFDVLHLPAAFPEVFQEDRQGFDVVVGNPPWDKVRFEPQQFWVTRHPGLNTVPASRREEHMDDLRESYPQQAKEEERERRQREHYQAYVKSAFKDQGGGHYDYAKLFVERATDLLTDEGKLGYVLPRQSLVLSGWKKLRHRLLDDALVTALQARNSGGWIFENVHHSYMIVLITSSPGLGEGAHIWPAIEEEQALGAISIDNSIYLTYDDLTKLTTEDRLVIPWFNNAGARDVFPKMERRSRLSREDGWITGKHDARWDFRGSGPHSHLSNSERESHHWRVFMTRSVDQFQINEEKEFRRFVDPDQLYQEGSDLVMEGDEIKIGANHPTVTFRHVSRNDDTRTMIATMLPESDFIYCKGYVHAVDHETGTGIDKLLALLTYFNSFTCDWWARRIVDRHVTSPAINNLPIPDWSPDQIDEAARIGAEFTQRGGIETLPGGHSVADKTGFSDYEPDELKAIMESIVADGFGFHRGHMETILQDFTDNAASEGLRSEILDRVPKSQ